MFRRSFVFLQNSNNLCRRPQTVVANSNSRSALFINERVLKNTPLADRKLMMTAPSPTSSSSSQRKSRMFPPIRSTCSSSSLSKRQHRTPSQGIMTTTTTHQHQHQQREQHTYSGNKPTNPQHQQQQRFSTVSFADHQQQVQLQILRDEIAASATALSLSKKQCTTDDEEENAKTHHQNNNNRHQHHLAVDSTTKAWNNLLYTPTQSEERESNKSMMMSSSNNNKNSTGAPPTAPIVESDDDDRRDIKNVSEVNRPPPPSSTASSSLTHQNNNNTNNHRFNPNFVSWKLQNHLLRDDDVYESMYFLPEKVCYNNLQLLTETSAAAASTNNNNNVTKRRILQKTQTSAFSLRQQEVNKAFGYGVFAGDGNIHLSSKTKILAPPLLPSTEEIMLKSMFASMFQ